MRLVVKHSLDVQGHEGVGQLSVLLTVIEQYLFTANHHILQKTEKTNTISGHKRGGDLLKVKTIK